MAQEQMTLRGTLQRHGVWVAHIATNPQYPGTILATSRCTSRILWKLTKDDTNYYLPYKSFHGQGHFVSDVVLSLDGQCALSLSWDKTLSLWNLDKPTRRVVGHKKDVLRVAFSADNRRMVSASRGKNIKLWDTVTRLSISI